MDFTFEKFSMTITSERLIIAVKYEAPMDLIHLHQVVEIGVDVNRKEILEADTVHFTLVLLVLKDEVFPRLKKELLKVSDVKELFQIEADGASSLRSFANYEIEEYGTTTSISM